MMQWFQFDDVFSLWLILNSPICWNQKEVCLICRKYWLLLVRSFSMQVLFLLICIKKIKKVGWIFHFFFLLKTIINRFLVSLSENFCNGNSITHSHSVEWTLNMFFIKIWGEKKNMKPTIPWFNLIFDDTFEWIIYLYH